jgi:hypothetical protein
MTLNSDLNKLRKIDLTNICKDNGVDIPKSAKTKAQLVKFMAKYDAWPKPLEEILGSTSGPAKAKKTKKTKKKTSKAVKSTPSSAAPSGVSKEGIKDLVGQINTLSKVIDDLKVKLLDDVKSLKSGLQKTDSKTVEMLSDIQTLQASIKELATATPSSPSSSSSSEMNQIKEETMVMEAIPEEEFSYLEDVFEFLEDIPKYKFKEIIKHLLLFKAIEGEEADGDLFVELFDGTKVSMVKR